MIGTGRMRRRIPPTTPPAVQAIRALLRIPVLLVSALLAAVLSAVATPAQAETATESAYIAGAWFGEQKPYYCGPAAVQTAIQRRLHSLTVSQDEVAAHMGTTSDGTNSSRQIMWGLNRFGSTDWYHAMAIGGSVTATQREAWRNDVVYNIDHGYPVVVNLQTDGSGTRPPNWPARLVFHYVTVVGYFDHGRQVRVVDSAAGAGGGLNSDWAGVQQEWTAATDDIATWMQGHGYAAHPAPGSAPGIGPESGPSVTSGNVYTMWGDSANVRSRPSTSSATVRSVAQGARLRVLCQKHAQLVAAEGTSNDAWSYLPEQGGWITNIYLQGPAWLPGIPICPSGYGGTDDLSFRTWGDGANIRSLPSAGSSLVATVPGGATLSIQCQKHGQSVSAEGATNDAWSYLPQQGGWITNIYVEGPAWLPGVPECPSDFGTPAGASGGYFRMWGESANVRTQPSLSGTVVRSIGRDTQVRASCQKHGQSVSAEGTTNDAWSYLPEQGGWITNIYLEGPAWLPGVPTCGADAGSGTAVAGAYFWTWGGGVNVRTQPSASGGIVRNLPGGTSAFVACQYHGDPVSAEGTTNDVWSYLPEQGGWITNIYLQGPAWLPGVPDCDALAVSRLEPRQP